MAFAPMLRGCLRPCGGGGSQAVAQAHARAAAHGLRQRREERLHLAGQRLGPGLDEAYAFGVSTLVHNLTR